MKNTWWKNYFPRRTPSMLLRRKSLQKLLQSVFQIPCWWGWRWVTNHTRGRLSHSFSKIFSLKCHFFFLTPYQYSNENLKNSSSHVLDAFLELNFLLNRLISKAKIKRFLWNRTDLTNFFYFQIPFCFDARFLTL